MSKLIITKHIADSRLVLYQNMGWRIESSYANREGTFHHVARTLITDSDEDEETVVRRVEPTKFQWGLIKRPLGFHDKDPLGDAVEFDYNGTESFPTNALPLSLRRVQSQLGLYTIHKIEGIEARDAEGRSFVLRVFANFDSEDDQRVYTDALREAFVYSEVSGLELSHQVKLLMSEDVDFWWDVENDVFMSFDNQFMGRLEKHLKISFSMMDQRDENSADTISTV